MHAGLRSRSGPIFGAVLVLGAIAGLTAPLVPTAAATAPSPIPTDNPATPSTGVSLPPDSPTPAPAPSDASQPPSHPHSGSPAPSSSPLPSHSAAPSGSPAPSASVAPSDSPSPSPSDLLANALALVDPTSPHIVGDNLTNDGCAGCHQTHHASQPSLLSTMYRINPLLASGEAYAAGNFALCWTCHSATQPAIEDATGATPGTNFPLHGFHLEDIGSFGTGGVNIETPGDGQGNAVCAECHYNLHGTPSSQRGLVVFAPDVLPYNGQPISYDATSGTCTLTCHGIDHNGAVVLSPAGVPLALPSPSPSDSPSPSPSDSPSPSPSDSPSPSPSDSPSPSPSDSPVPSGSAAPSDSAVPLASPLSSGSASPRILLYLAV